MSNQEQFIKYVRTKQFFKQRLRGEEHDTHQSVHISSEEIEKRFFPYPKYNRKAELQKLEQSGHLKIDTTEQYHTYRALLPGGIDISLLPGKNKNYSPGIKQMRDHLLKVSLPTGAESTPYFDLFLKHRKNYIDYFFTVDDFASRVHTPVSGLKNKIRANLLLDEEPTTSFDVAQMQPILLGKVLEEKIGENEFTTWINEGRDIYIMLQDKAGLKDRSEAKDRFYEMTFGIPDHALERIFGAAPWIRWINNYKSHKQPGNPSEKIYSNLAWLMQTTEVQTMRKIWKLLINAGIIFCTVHDEIIVKEEDSTQALEAMNTVLSQSFARYKINAKK